MSERRFSLPKTIASRGKQHACSFFATLDDRVTFERYKNGTHRWCFHIKRTIYGTENRLSEMSTPSPEISDGVVLLPRNDGNRNFFFIEHFERMH